MTVQHDIARAELRHGPVKELRRQLTAQVAQELAFEVSTEHQIAMHLMAIESGLQGLSEIATKDERGLLLVKAEKASITRSYFTVSLLLSALKG